MKKLLALLLAMVMVLSLAGCGEKASDPAVEVPEDGNNSLAVEEEPDPWSHQFTQYGNGKIQIVGSEFTKNDYDEDVLRVYYDYTNTDETLCGHYLNTALNFLSVTQDGNDCRNVSFTGYDEATIPEDLNADLYVQPGCTIRNTMCFLCDPNGGPVKVSCYLMIGSWMYNPEEIKPFEFEVDPANLMGAPDPFVLPPITDPTYTDGLAASGVYGSAENRISINGIELTKDSEGETVVRVKLTVTNNGEEAMSPALICDLELYQDGIGLPYPTTWDMAEPTVEDEAYEEELEPGETVDCNALFYLRNNNPVEAVVENTGGVTLGACFDVQSLLDEAAAANQAASDAANAAEAAARKALVGTWLQRESEWEDAYVFNIDGTGASMMSGGYEYPFTYSVSGDTLTLTYGPEEEAEFTFSVESDLLTLIDLWDEELLLDRTEDIETETVAPEPAVEATPEPAPQPEETEEIVPAEELIGTWVNESYGETYVFNADGTGYQVYEGDTYEYTYTVDEDYVEIFYADFDEDAFYIEFDGDTLIIAGYYTYTRR